MYGAGSYKECYFVGDVAVKFALVCNETLEREKPVYDKALENHLDAIFAHTVFLPLEKSLPPYFVGCDDCSYDSDEAKDCGRPGFDCVILQEKIPDILGNHEACHTISWYDNGKTYKQYPLFNEGKKIPYKTVKSLVQIFCYQEWIQAAINPYGLKFMLELATLCDEMHVDDLHSFNLGFRADGSPVIFDFLS